jgi:Ca2+-binding RTX toxin-like protein
MSAYPYDCVCYITATFNGVGSFRGSGVIIGPHTILTASHVLWDSSAQESASSVSVFPDDSTGPSGTAISGQYVEHFNQINEISGGLGKDQSQNDYAVIDVAQTLTSYGSFGLDPNYQGGVVHVTGYPAESQSFYTQTDQQGNVSADPNYSVLDYGSGLNVIPGNSGGPLWVDLGTSGNPQPYAVGIVSTTGYAVQLTSADVQTIQNWESSDSYLWASTPNQVIGTQGDDALQGTSGNDVIFGLAGNDSLLGHEGNDLVCGNEGDDIVVGGQGDDTAVGGQGNDVVFGNLGNDMLLGNLGNDALYGGQGDDTIYGGQGDDYIVGGAGNDLLVGGLGNDTFAFNEGDTNYVPATGTGDTIADFATGQDKIDFLQGPAGTATNFVATSIGSAAFATIEAAAKALIGGNVQYVFVADGADGFLFADENHDGAIDDVVKLAGVGAAAGLKFSDIV